MRGSTYMPSLSELFNENTAEQSKSSNLPSLSELLKRNSTQNSSSLSTNVDEDNSNNFGFDNDDSSALSCKQCGVPSLNELSSDKLSKLNNRVDDYGNFVPLSEFGSNSGSFAPLKEFGNSPGKFPFLNELGNSPGKFTSLNELGNSPGKFLSLNELGNSPGKFTSLNELGLNELGNSPGKFTSLNELSNSPGKYTSLKELSNSPGKFISLNKLSQSPGNSPSLNQLGSSPAKVNFSDELCPGTFPSLNEFGNTPGKFPSFKEMSNHPGTIPSYPHQLSNSPDTHPCLNQLSNNVGALPSFNELGDLSGTDSLYNECSEKNTSTTNVPSSPNPFKEKLTFGRNLPGNDSAMELQEEKHECIDVSLTSFKWNNNTDKEGDNEALPTLLSLLAIENDNKTNKSDTNILKPTIDGLHKDELLNISSISSSSLDDQQPSVLENSTAENIPQKTKKTYLTKPSKFAKVVGATTPQTNQLIQRLNNQLKRNYNLTSPTEVILTDTSNFHINTDDIFSFSTPSPDDIVLSHHEKAYKRDY